MLHFKYLRTEKKSELKNTNDKRIEEHRWREGEREKGKEDISEEMNTRTEKKKNSKGIEKSHLLTCTL